ncbi:putative O-glycosylation ligase, exosortase A system-associated [Rhodoferax sp. PAMC 29310]|uniref:putative O-glycosylation ligase, exosortase A system-associated n=1 Tax=Rhodoferax sp. PAMC 29310 TaxID=2822760 RepID=UPI001F0AB1F4|nr:putative O-glycosylation ligase, exosortase A system-associated [Rhodoferax sp. PAMC 29310]
MAGCLAALRRPWIGIMLWTWLSIMNPHRYTWGIAYSAPLAAMAAASVLLGLLMTKDRESPFKASPVTWLVVFMVWMTISWLAGIDPSGDYEQWKKVMKIDFFIILSLMLLHSKQHIFALMWVCAGSLALLGVKGGIFTLTSGGNFRVWGPPGSFIGDNNEFALALVIAIPLLRFMQLQLQNRWARHGMTMAMALCAAAALGSQSRGALLAISAMTLYFWWHGKNKITVGIVLLSVAVPLIMFMPESWTARMSTIGTYQEDASAMGRISAWWSAWNSAFHYPFGVGFDGARPELFALYSPYGANPLAAHSIYFQVLGNHGFGGLFLFLGTFIATWRSAGWLRRCEPLTPEAQWCRDLGTFCQVSIAGFAVGGAFLSLSYFDLPYNILVMVVLTRVWVEKKSWLTEPIYPLGWKTIPGLAARTKEG